MKIDVRKSSHPDFVWEVYAPKKFLGRLIRKGFQTRALAESYRADLLEEKAEEAVPLTEEIRLITKRFQGKLTPHRGVVHPKIKPA